VSTAWVYGLDAEPDTHEDSPLRLSRDPYTDTKLESEQVIRALVAERRLPAVIVQPTEVYGPGDRHWTLSAIRLLESGRMILPAGGKGVIQPIFIDDVAEGAVLALRHGRVGEAYLLTGTQVVSVREFFGCLASIVGRRRVPSVPRWLALVGAFLAESGARLTGTAPIFTRSAVRGTTMKATYLSGQDSKAYRELGFMPRVGLAEGMSAVQAWLAAQ
jgi:dihydroflavonol-4-reductase